MGQQKDQRSLLPSRILIPRRKFLRTAAGLVAGFPFILKGQLIVVPGTGAIIGAAGKRLNGGGGGGPSNPAVTGQSLGTLRNDYTGSVGFRFLVNTNITVTDLGRWVVSGNSGTHAVKIHGPGGSYSTLATGNVNTSGATAGAYAYQSITPLSLTSGLYYRIESDETSGGDQWYDTDTTISTTGDITDDGHSVNGTGSGSGNDSYVPVNFKYHT